MKSKFEPIILARDGANCFYCEKPFPTKIFGVITLPIDKDQSKEYDHLNNDKAYNEVQNLVFAHRICNRQKMFNQAWINKARTKLRDNERSADLPSAHADTDKEISAESDTNNIFSQIVLETLAFFLQKEGNNPPRTEEVNVKEFLDLVAGKAYKIIGHASQVTMRRILDMFCTKEFQYVKEKNNEWRWIIRLRKEDEY